MEEKKTEELADETLDSVSGGARELIAGVDAPSLPDAQDQDAADPQDPAKPRGWYGMRGWYG